MSEPRTILIVDDSPTMRALLKLAVRRFGSIRILEGNNGEEALGHLATEKVDCVLTDVNMPVMDGLTLIDRIKADPKLAGIPIVVITTEGAPAERERAMAKGAVEYLSKPIQGALVVSVLNRVLGPG